MTDSSKRKYTLEQNMAWHRTNGRPMVALNMLKEKVQQEGYVPSIRVLIEKGHCNRDLGRWQGAEDAYRLAMRKNVNNSDAWEGFIEIARLRGDKEQQEARCGHAVEHCPNDPVFLVKWVKLAIERDDLEEADRRLKERISIFENNVGVIGLWGSVAAKRGDYEESKRRYMIGLKIEPDNQHFLAGVSNAQLHLRQQTPAEMRAVLKRMNQYRMLNSPDEAISIGLDLIEHYGEKAEVLQEISLAYMDNQQYREAKLYAARAIQSEHSSISFGLLVNIAFAEGDYDAAISLCGKIMEIFPGAASGDIGLVRNAAIRTVVNGTIAKRMQELRGNGDDEALNEAIGIGKTSIVARPKLDVICELAACYVAAGRADEAEALYKKYIEQFANPRLNLGYACVPLENGHDYAAAEARLKTVMTECPGYAPAYQKLGHILNRQQRFEEAEAFLKEAHEKFPNDHTILSELAKVAYGLVGSAADRDAYKGAVSYARQSIALGGNVDACDVLSAVADKTQDEQMAQEAAEHLEAIARAIAGRKWRLGNHVNTVQGGGKSASL